MFGKHYISSRFTILATIAFRYVTVICTNSKSSHKHIITSTQLVRCSPSQYKTAICYAITNFLLFLQFELHFMLTYTSLILLWISFGMQAFAQIDRRR